MPSTTYLGGHPVEILERIFVELYYFIVWSVKLVCANVLGGDP